MRFRLATWNINSVRLRLDLVERLVRAERPDILCLQEIKCVDGLFPEMPLCALGFDHVAIAGQKGYHGVAILSRIPFSKVAAPRHLWTRSRAALSVTLDGGASQAKPIALHNVYVPAGGDVPDPSLNPKFRHKLDFLEAMEAWFARMRGKRSNRMILVGDLNVAPLETDVWSHKQLLKVVSHTPAEIERFLRVQAAHDLIDVMRRHVPARRSSTPGGATAIAIGARQIAAAASIISGPRQRSTAPRPRCACWTKRGTGRAPRTTFRSSPISRLSESPTADDD